MDGPKCMTSEKRYPPSEDDFRSLMRQNMIDIGHELDEASTRSTDNKECLRELSWKLDQVIKHVADHDAASKELLENFRFQRQLRKWWVGIITGITMIVTLWLQSEHFFAHIAEFFKPKP